MTRIAQFYLLALFLPWFVSCARTDPDIKLPSRTQETGQIGRESRGYGTGSDGMSDSPLFWDAQVSIPPYGFGIVHSAQRSNPSVAALSGRIAIADGSILVLILPEGRSIPFDCGEDIVSGPLFAGKSEVWVASGTNLRGYPSDGDETRHPLATEIGFKALFLASDASGTVYAASGDGMVTAVDGTSVKWKIGLGRGVSCLMVRERRVFAGTTDGVVALGADSGTVTAESERGFAAAAFTAGNGVVAVRQGDGVFRFLDIDTLAAKTATGIRDVTAGPVFADNAFLFAGGSQIRSCVPGTPGSALVAEPGGSVTFLGMGKDTAFGVSDNALFTVFEGKTSRFAFVRSRPRYAVPDGAGGLLAVTDASRIWKSAAEPGGAGTVSAFESLFMPSDGIKDRIAEKAAAYSGVTDGRIQEARYDAYSAPVPVVLGDGYSVFAFSPPESKTFRVSVEIAGVKSSQTSGNARGNPAFVSVFGDQGDALKSNVDELGLDFSFDHPFELGRTYWIAVGPSYEGAKGITVILRVR